MSKIELRRYQIKGRNPQGEESKTNINLSSPDICPPSILAYTLCDTEGRVGYVCNSIENSELRFATSDLNYNGEPYFDYRFERPAGFEVEYAPHGSNNWTHLGVQMPYGDEFQPAIGWVYTVDMDQIFVHNNENYYDLRLSVKDEAGNEQIETIRPAFYIANTSICNPVFNDKTKGVQRIYGIDGIQRKCIEPGINIIVTNEGSVMKIVK